MVAPLSYADCPLDRATHLRADTAWIEARRRDAASVFVIVCRDRNLFIKEPPRALLVRGPNELTRASESFAFLGVSRPESPDSGDAWFAVEAEEHLTRPWAAASGGVFTELRRMSGRLPAGEAAILAYARALMNWHRRHRFCGVCGGPTGIRDGGHTRVCVGDGCEALHFPRTDPAIIVLVTRAGAGGETGAECLLARQPGWPKGLISTLAGFVEPGETAEAAVVREVREEAGVDVARVRYAGSQPWPFPSSLMLAFRASAPPAAEIVVDRRELEYARWFSRAEVLRLADIGFKLPTADSIARRLIADWLAEAGADDRHLVSSMEAGR